MITWGQPKVDAFESKGDRSINEEKVETCNE